MRTAGKPPKDILREGRSAWLLVPAALSLAVFAWLLSLHPTAAGRVYAAYDCPPEFRTRAKDCWFMNEIVLESVIACPVCGHQKRETMPTDACQWFYECEACKTVLKPKPGDCCVYCSFGTNPCPPKQVSAGGAQCC